MTQAPAPSPRFDPNTETEFDLAAAKAVEFVVDAVNKTDDPRTSLMIIHVADSSKGEKPSMRLQYFKRKRFAGHVSVDLPASPSLEHARLVCREAAAFTHEVAKMLKIGEVVVAGAC